jgi:membrane protease YdiL (CAAX protease family)
VIVPVHEQLGRAGIAWERAVWSRRRRQTRPLGAPVSPERNVFARQAANEVGRPTMPRKPAFWTLALLLCALATWVSVRGFPLAFPIVTLDLRMDRAGALAAARERAASHGWGPEGFRQAAMFDLDSQVQAFVELEAGGNEAFARLIEEGLYHPYRWRVRHFKPLETTETELVFAPSGKPFGFRERLPEDQAGAALDSEAARALAEQEAARWPEDLSPYRPVATSREVRASGRVDHTFVYERPTPTLGEGRYRLRLVVSGDRFTELTHLVKIPEAFERRYGEMRSANDAIAAGSGLATVLILGVGGCGVGLFLLLRRRWVTWKHALAWGLLVGGLEAAAFMGFWPLLWMEYDTAVSAANFTLLQLAVALIQFLAIAGITTLVLMAAESLTRRAFPGQIQLFKLWSPSVAGSPAVLGRTVAGFLLVAGFAVYEVALYFLARRSLGWWQPSDALSNPNLLASHFPWLTAVGLSLRAGVTEECLFRAVPLASAALLGQRFGGRRYWILGALLLQAVLFGAAHANYPAQPAYARLVELVLPSLGWGALYLTLGLLPCIVCHFAVDVVFIGLPIFTSSAPNAWMHQTVIVVLTLVPLWVVLGARLRRGTWGKVDESALNRAWSPPPVAERPIEPEVVVAAQGFGTRWQAALVGLGVIGLVAWGTRTSFTSDAPPVEVDRGRATAAARRALEERGIRLAKEWHEFGWVEGTIDQADRFVWQQGGPQVYRGLLGRYLAGPRWRIRYARFEGDVAERAEEYQVWTDGVGRVTRFLHRLPEARPGASLEAAEARARAEAFLRQVHGLDPGRLEEVSAEPQKQPERRDWKLVFRDPAVDPRGRGEARIAVNLAGDEIVDSSLFVHAPEEWRRQETDRESGARNVRIAARTVLVLLLAAGGVLGIVRWSRGRLSSRAFFTSLAFVAVVNLASFLNMWPRAIAEFRTEIAFELQVGLILAGVVLVLVLTAATIALNIGLAHRWLPSPALPAPPFSLAAGAGLGALLAGLGAALARLLPSAAPTWADASGANALFPWLAGVLVPVGQWITPTALLLVVVAALHSGTAGWSRRRLPFSALVLIVGLVLAGSGNVESPLLWLGGGLAAGGLLLAAYVLVLRHQPALLPVATAAIAGLNAVREALMRGFAGARPGFVLGALVMLALGCLWSRALTEELEARSSGPGAYS